MNDVKSSPLDTVDDCVVTGFYGLVSIAAIAFLLTVYLPIADADFLLATAWFCIFASALCLLLRLSILAWDDMTDRSTQEG